jgi:hypothetical protein
VEVVGQGVEDELVQGGLSFLGFGEEEVGAKEDPLGEFAVVEVCGGQPAHDVGAHQPAGQTYSTNILI